MQREVLAVVCRVQCCIQKGNGTSSVAKRLDTLRPTQLGLHVTHQLRPLVQSFHRLPSSKEKPIAFASHTFSKAEHNHVQIECEALAIVFVVRNSVSIFTDGNSRSSQITAPYYVLWTTTWLQKRVLEELHTGQELSE